MVCSLNVPSLIGVTTILVTPRGRLADRGGSIMRARVKRLLRSAAILIGVASAPLAAVGLCTTNADHQAAKKARSAIERQLSERGATEIAVVDDVVVVSLGEGKNVRGAVRYTEASGAPVVRTTSVWLFQTCLFVGTSRCWSVGFIGIGALELTVSTDGTTHVVEKRPPFEYSPSRTDERDSRSVCSNPSRATTTNCK